MNESSESVPDDRLEWVEPEIVELNDREVGEAAARSSDEKLKQAMISVGQRERRDSDARKDSVDM